MQILRNPKAAKFGFIFSTFLLVMSLYRRVEEPLPFFFFAGGLIVFSFFIMRAIGQLVR